MLIVFNPPTGSPIKGFNLNGDKVELHDINQMKQYADEYAQALKNTYPFLRIITPNQVEEVKKEAEEKVQGEFKCDKCDYSSDKKIGLIGHMRGHAKEEEIIPDIPVAQTVKVAEVKLEEKTTEVPDDLKGTDWYGEGVKESHE